MKERELLLEGKKFGEKYLEAYKNDSAYDNGDIMAFWIGVDSVYRDCFVERFPFKSYKGNDSIEGMLQCLIDGKPYKPDKATA